MHRQGHPCNAFRTPSTNSLISTRSSPFASKGEQPPSGCSPSAMRTPEMRSFTVTSPLWRQSPTQMGRRVPVTMPRLGVGVRATVAIALGAMIGDVAADVGMAADVGIVLGVIVPAPRVAVPVAVRGRVAVGVGCSVTVPAALPVLVAVPVAVGV